MGICQTSFAPFDISPIETVSRGFSYGQVLADVKSELNPNILFNRLPILH